MEWLFFKLWSFVLWICSSLLAIFRGRTITLPPEDGTVSNLTFLPPTFLEPWLDKVRYLFIRVVYVTVGKKKKQEPRLVIDLPGLVPEERFNDLRVCLFFKGQTNGTLYAVDTKNIRLYSSHTIAMPLKPVSSVYTMIAAIEVGEGDGYAANLERIDLITRKERRSFFYNEKTGYFEPKSAKVVNS